MRRVPEVRKPVAPPRLSPQDDPYHLAVRGLGTRYDGKFKTAKSGYKYLLVAVDKFTKWIEAKPVKNADEKTATKFLREIIYRFSYPHSIITDNGTNFA